MFLNLSVSMVALRIQQAFIRLAALLDGHDEVRKFSISQENIADMGSPDNDLLKPALIGIGLSFQVVTVRNN